VRSVEDDRKKKKWEKSGKERVGACVCVCVCVWERERESERWRKIDGERVKEE
jgi:hypothetical protein